VPALCAWLRLLGPGVEVSLDGLFDPTSESPNRVLADLTALQTALERARVDLVAAGHRATTRLIVDDDAPEDATLVLRVARRGVLRRWFAGPDGARRQHRCPRLLVPASALAMA
jgi:hypothetical protein